jgi:signal peptidase
MVYFFIDDIIVILLISAFLITIYLRIVHNWNFIEKVEQRYSKSDINNRVKDRIKYIGRQPIDRQKVIFQDLSMLSIVLLVIILIGTQTIFFAVVVSDSMIPTFSKNDMILMQNIDRTYSVGDIVMFKRPDTSIPTSHRIISIGDEGIRTAGDATKTMDWWKLQNEDIVGKAVTIQGKPITIKGYGAFFIVEDKNQRFGPFDYQNYYLFINIIKIYGYAIAVIALVIYIILTFKREKGRSYLVNK